jgi:hypothetical protein
METTAAMIGPSDAPETTRLRSALLKSWAQVFLSGTLEKGTWPVSLSWGEVHTLGLSTEDVQSLFQAGYVEMAVEEMRSRVDRSTAAQRSLILTRRSLEMVADALSRLAIGEDQPEGKAQEARKELPRWIAIPGGGGELWVGQRVLKRVRHDAASQRAVLEALEQTGWPKWMRNPLLGRRGQSQKRALRETVRSLNKGQEPLRVCFHVVDGGVAYEMLE